MVWRGAGQGLEGGMGRKMQPGRLFSAVGWTTRLQGRSFRLLGDAVDGVQSLFQALRVVLKSLSEACSLCGWDPVHVVVELDHTLLVTCTLTAEERSHSGLHGSKFPQSCRTPPACTWEIHT